MNWRILSFVENRPTKETAQTLRDELLFQRATQTYLWALPLINTLGMKEGSEKVFGAGYHGLPIWKKRLDAKRLGRRSAELVRATAALLPLIAASVVLLFVLAGCGNSSIVGKWRMLGSENQTVWEFSSNGSVLVGEVRGRYKFGDQDRIKIETPFATTVYLVKLSSDQLVLEQPGGSKLEFTRLR